MPFSIRPFRCFLTVFLVVACATDAAAGSIEEANFAYERGEYAQAARLLRPLAEKEDAKAQSKLGMLYYRGNGVPKDYPVALRRFRKAAEQGDGSAQIMLGRMYFNGHGVPQDFVRAHMWVYVSLAGLDGDFGKAGAIDTEFAIPHMTAVQFEKAREMARRCQQMKFKECD
jgi:uncharacterized protein